MDKIILEGIRLSVNVGVTEKERRKKQPILVDVVAEKNLKHVGNHLDRTIDYAALLVACQNAVANQEFVLIEQIAENIAHVAKKLGAAHVTVRVHKPKAFLKNPAKAFVEIQR